MSHNGLFMSQDEGNVSFVQDNAGNKQIRHSFLHYFKFKVFIGHTCGPQNESQEEPNLWFWF